MSNKKLYWWKSIVSMGVILGSMPMVHLVARVLKDNYDGTLEDWAVGDPALASAEGVEAIRDDIAARVRTLLDSLTTH